MNQSLTTYMYIGNAGDEIAPDLATQTNIGRKIDLREQEMMLFVSENPWDWFWSLGDQLQITLFTSSWYAIDIDRMMTWNWQQKGQTYLHIITKGRSIL